MAGDQRANRESKTELLDYVRARWLILGLACGEVLGAIVTWRTLK